MRAGLKSIYLSRLFYLSRLKSVKINFSNYYTSKYDFWFILDSNIR